MNNKLSVGLFEELEAIYPDTQALRGSKFYEVTAASDIYTGVHLVVSGLKAGQIVSFEVKGPHKQYKFFEMIPVPVEENSGKVSRTELLDRQYNPDVIRRALFMIYEVLRPMRNIVKSTGFTVAVDFREWVNVSKNEDHLWEIHVIVGEVIQKVTFRVETKAIQVPLSGKEIHKYVNWISLEKITQFHHVPMWSEEWERLVKSYFKLARYGRQNIAWLPLTYYFELDEIGRPQLNTKKLDKLIEMVDESGMYWLQGLP